MADVTAPFQYCGTTGFSGVSTATLSVTAATAAGDALTLAVGLNGSSPPSVASVTDTAGNTYSLAKSYTAGVPALYVFTATGATAALTTSSTVTVNFSSNTTGAFQVLGTDCPGTSTIDVSAIANGSSAAPSVSGTPSQAGETALAVFLWSGTGGAGTISSPFTFIAREQAGSNAYLTSAYDLSPTSGSSLSPAASITSTAWRAVLLTFQATAAPPVGRSLITAQAVKRAAFY